MKLVKFALVLVIAPIFVHANANVGKTSLKLSDENAALRIQVAQKEIQKVDARIATINEEIKRMEMDRLAVAPIIQPGLTNVREGLGTIVSGLEAERAQLMSQRAILMTETTLIAQ